MKALISKAVADTSTMEAIKSAIARKDSSETALLRPLHEKARQLDDNAWEVMLTIAGEAAGELAAMARKEFGNDASVETDVITPLTMFAESIKASPEAWLANTPEGSVVTSEVAAGLLKALLLLQGNPFLRMDLLKKFNDSVEKSVTSGGVKVVIDAKTSIYTKKPLKPLSKRDLTAQLKFAVDFLMNNPDGFTIH